MRSQCRIAVIAAVCLWLASAASGQAPAAAGNQVVALRGSLSVVRGRQPARPLALHGAVQPGDELITDATSEATIRASDGSTVHLFPDSHVIFSEQSPDIREFLHLFLGSIKVHIEKLSGRPNPHQMTTPTAVIAVRGTTFSVFVDETDATLVAVDEGIVSVANVRDSAREVILHRGQRTWVRPGQPPIEAQRFRGRSERADLMPLAAQRGMSGETSGAMQGGMGSMAGSGSARSMGGMSGRPGPH